MPFIFFMLAYIVDAVTTKAPPTTTLANSPTPPVDVAVIKCRKFLTPSTANPATGPMAKPAIRAGISDISIFKKLGNKPGIGISTNINTNAIADNRETFTSFFVDVLLLTALLTLSIIFLLISSGVKKIPKPMASGLTN